MELQADLIDTLPVTAVEIVNQMGVSAKAEHVNALAAIAESKVSVH